MTEVLFYHLSRQPLEKALQELLEKSLERHWRVVVQAGTNERVEALDAYLWTYRDESFLPHGVSSDGQASEHPILLTAESGNPNRSTVRFLVDGAPFPDDAASYERIVLIFDGDDPDAVAAARERWVAAKSSGHAVTYWQRDENGRWTKKG